MAREAQDDGDKTSAKLFPSRSATVNYADVNKSSQPCAPGWRLRFRKAIISRLIDAESEQSIAASNTRLTLPDVVIRKNPKAFGGYVPRTP